MIFSALAMAFGCSGTTWAASLATVRVAAGLELPIFVTAPAGDDRLFVLEQRGVIRVVRNRAVLSRPFLDIERLVADLAHAADERGLLGLAFDPEYATNGRFYVHYSDRDGDTVVARYLVSSDPNVADPASGTTVLTQDQPFANHNGGSLAFGPDGFLYFGLGDGGSANDPGNRAQNPGTLLGKMLRLDVRGSGGYTIPRDNPFVGRRGARPEIWALGLRNPYRWSFDRTTGDLWIADVGQGVWEEIDRQPASSRGGENYGWRLMEGPECFRPSADCGTDTLVQPLHAYDQRVGSRCAVTGGYVYRGAAIPELAGTYLFADYCSGEIWGLRVGGDGTPRVEELRRELAPGGDLALEYIAGFGEDGSGELYIVDRGTGEDGEIYRIVDSAAGGSPASGLALSPPSPGSFHDRTRLELSCDRPGSARVDVLDSAGRQVRSLFQGRVNVTHELEWDGRGDTGAAAAPGRYVIRARAGDEWVSRRVDKVR